MIGTLIFLVIVGILYHNIPLTKRFTPIRIVAVLIVAGAIGNMIDRVVHQYVIDFFYFKLINFPIFNVADIYVVVACILFILLMLFYYKEEELGQIFPFMKSKKRKSRGKFLLCIMKLLKLRMNMKRNVWISFWLLSTRNSPEVSFRN